MEAHFLACRGMAMSGVTTGELERRAQLWFEEDFEDDVVGCRELLRRSSESWQADQFQRRRFNFFHHAVKPKQILKEVHHCFQGEWLQIVNGKKDCA